MRISPERLESEAESTGFRADVLEKAILLLATLDAICNHPVLKGKLALKGGTALNLFVFEVPRLSVDIDLNYVGSWKRDEMLEERPKIEKAIQMSEAYGAPVLPDSIRKTLRSSLPAGLPSLRSEDAC